MLTLEDLIMIEKNHIMYKQNGVSKRSIPVGVYEVITKQFNESHCYKTLFELEMIGSQDDPVTISWKSLQYNNKWRKL